MNGCLVFNLLLSYIRVKHNTCTSGFARGKMSGHGNGFVTSEPKLLYLKSPGVKFMNHFTDLRNPLLKSFGSYKV